jgi:hypothetical protein
MAGEGGRAKEAGRKGADVVDVRARIEALAAGDPRLAACFIEELAPVVWAACTVLTGDVAEAREAFLEMNAKLSADNFCTGAQL